MNPDAARASSLAAAARALVGQASFDDTLEAVARTARESLPGFDHVSVALLSRSGRIETKAVTDSLARDLDSLQYSVDEGPCLSAIRDVTMVAVPDLREEQRWPRYLPGAISAGLRAQMSVPLAVDDEHPIGGLNLYSTSRGSSPTDADEMVTSFATHASIALHEAGQIANLRDALESRQVIGQAIGIIMERYRLSEDRAFAYLVRASSHANIKLRQIARDLVNENNSR
ncbi:MAG TPA: GAF and ANTAR domain-containing protein [Nocardioidaceae bacterium]|nr:GAF and ANTAR domain-containing protein [Nocardioidaceae bacterium]